MAKLVLPNSFGFQPQYPPPIDQSGLGGQAKFVLLGNQSLRESVNGIARTGTAGILEANAEGVAYVLPSAGNSWAKQIDALDPYVSGSFSVHWRGILRSNTAQTLLSCLAGVGWKFITNGWAPGQSQFGLTAYWRGSTTYTSAVSFSDGLHSLDLIYNDAASTVQFFLDGVAVSSPTAWSKDPGAIGSSMTFGVQGDATSPHKPLCVQAFAGALTSAQVKSLNDNSWQIFKAPARRLWAVPSSSGINLIGSNASQANTSSTGAVTQTQVLAGANSSQSNTASAAAVTQTQVLSGANSSQANTSSTSSVTQTQILAGANSAQSNLGSSGAITLSGAIVLVGANATQANSGGTGVITQVQVLIAAMATQANACAVGAITNSDIYLPPKNSDFVWLGFASGEC